MWGFPRRLGGTLVALVVCGATLAACSSSPAAHGGTGTSSPGTTAPGGGSGGSTSTSTTQPPAAGNAPVPAGQIVTPSGVAAIVAHDTVVNNAANAAFSIPLQNTHETCLQGLLDDLAFKGEKAAGAADGSPAFSQVAAQPFVPRESSYPAYFSVVAGDVSSGSPKTNDFLTYVKPSASSPWKLDGVTEILGPTAAGVPVPKPLLDSKGFATPLDQSSSDGLAVAPGKVPALVASAFTTQAATGKLPAGVSAQFGPGSSQSPQKIASSWTEVGNTSVTYTPDPPSAAASGVRSGSCPFPAWRLADGGALVMFPLFNRIEITVRSSAGATQPSDRSVFDYLLPPGTYSVVTMLWSDIALAVVPPAGSKAPVEVIGQSAEPLGASGQLGGLITA